MKVTSPAFKNNERIPEKYTADGENINSRIIISDIPKGTKSIVMIMDDPDAERVVGYTWIHWLLFDIPVMGSEVIIEENSIIGKSGLSTYKKKEYGGPNPPKDTGVHNYFFRCFSLDKLLNLPEGSSREEIETAMKDHILESCNLIGKYSRV